MPSTPVPSVPLFQVNTGDSPGPGANLAANNSQINSKVIGLSNGNFLVVWQDGSSQTTFEPYDIRGQIYDSSATPVGGEFLVSSIYQDLDQQRVDIAPLPGGGFVAAYQTTDAAGFNDGENINVEIFDSAGAFVRFDDYRQGNVVPHGIDDTSPTVTTFSDGRYVLVYEEKDTTNPGAVTELVGYSVDAAGVRGAKFSIETVATDATGPSATTLSNGNFVVGFAVPGTSSVNFSIRTATGSPVFETAIAATSGVARVDVAALSGGGFVMAWQDANGDGAGDAGIRIAIYDNLGNPVKSSFAADITTTAGAQIEPAVTALADGGFVVAWNDAASHTVKAQAFTAAGSPAGNEATIASLNDVRDPSLGTLTDGRFVVSVDNNSGADFDIEAAIWNTVAPPSVTINQGVGQNDPSNHGSIIFDVAFSQGVTGFDQNDIALSGTAGATTAVVTAIDAAHYTVAVSGFARDGTVIASIPANAAQSGVLFSTASTSTDNIVTRDTIAPAAPTVVLASDTGSSSTDGITSNGAIIVTAAEAGGTLLYKADGAAVFSTSAPVFVTDGTHSVAVVQRDDAGNLSAAANLTFTLDTRAPDLTAHPPVTPGGFSSGGLAPILPAAISLLDNPARLVFSYLGSPGETSTAAFSISTLITNGASHLPGSGAADPTQFARTFYAPAVDASWPLAGDEHAPPPHLAGDFLLV